MPGCAAVGCSNSAKKGFLMKRFPKDPKRRKEWAIKTKRDQWKPTDTSCLCEIHFAPEMWEKKRVDGTRKLKASAVPTIFSFTRKVYPRRKSPTRRQQNIPNLQPSTGNPNEGEGEISVTTAALLDEMEAVDTEAVKTDAVEMEAVEIAAEETTTVAKASDNSTDITDSEETNCDDHSKLAFFEKMYLKQQQKIAKYKRELRNCKKQLKSLQNKSSEQQQNSLLNLLLSEDQKMALERKKRNISNKFLKWSNATVTKALKLKFSCGNNGYEELIRQGHPLPSIRTLQRRLLNLKFNSGILDEVFEFLKVKVATFQQFEKDCASC